MLRFLQLLVSFRRVGVEKPVLALFAPSDKGPIVYLHLSVALVPWDYLPFGVAT
ncbi:hypothetical protein ACMA1I_02985 [Pontibacter sp. 13R65]|uniref:hypothetical protein n=1 Tax=Pontibacter sp. 13R65 TaxID=3127458 RepID=UPI00301C3899